MSCFRFLSAVATALLFACSATPSSAASITYVDADFQSNTTLADGTAMNLVADEATIVAGANPEDYYVTADGTVNTTGLAPNNWGERTRSGLNGPSVLVGPQTATGDAAELRTRVTGLADGTYNVYAYFANGAWELEAGLSQGVLTAFNAGNTTEAVAADFANPVVLTGGGVGPLLQASLGTAVVSGGELDVFIDDAANGQRAWYDGVGYELAIPEPMTATLALFAGLAVAARRRSV